MSRLFTAIMRGLPQIMTAYAAIHYVATVVIALRAGDRLTQSFGDSVPAGYRLESFLIIFVQPLAITLIFLFGAALLWRMDQWLGRVDKPKEAAE